MVKQNYNINESEQIKNNQSEQIEVLQSQNAEKINLKQISVII